ncbi:hypothetical protein ABK040_004010 [Willaertia magna]
MLLIDLPLEIIFEITKFIPVKEIFNFLLISKEYYEFIEYDIFWKSLLKFYLLSEIRNCKEVLNGVILDKDLLQEFLKVNSLESKGNKKKNFKQLYKDNLLSITMNIRLLQNFIEFYKHNIIQLNSLTKNSFKRFLLKDLQHFNEERNNNEDHADLNNEKNKVNDIIFSKRFKHLLQQCIKCKWSVLLNFLTTFDINEQFQYMFIELFLNNNDNITLTEIDKYITIDDNNELIKRNNSQYFLQLLKQIKDCFYLKNIIYSNFTPKLHLFINICSILKNNKYDENYRNMILQKIMEFMEKYNLKISIITLEKACKYNLIKLSPKFFDFCLNHLNYDTYYNENLAEIINCALKEETEINEQFCEKANYLLTILIKDNYDKKQLFKYITTLIVCPRLKNLLLSENDKSKEIYNLFNSLQFLKYNITISMLPDYFNLHFNFNNFSNLVKLNVISNEELLIIFHKHLLTNSFDHYTTDFETKEILHSQLKLYLNFFINDLKLDIYYGVNKNYYNIFSTAVSCTNFSVIVDLIKECCNLQKIDYSKINFKNMDVNITRQLIYKIPTDKLYDCKELEEIKLKSIKEILSIDEITHIYFFSFTLSCNYNNKNLHTLPALKYLLLNIKMAFNKSIMLQEYVDEILKREDEFVLNNLITTQRATIINGYHNKTIDTNGDLFIYFIYKNIKNKIESLEKEEI